MSTTVPRQSASVAFRTETFASGAAALPNRRPLPIPPTAPARPQAIPASRPRHAAQTGWLLALVGVALLVVIAGMVYLSGYAQVTQEGYRHTKLIGQLKQETEKQQQAKQLKAIAYTAAHIEHKARALGMVAAEEKQMVTVGETTPTQLLQQSLLAAPADEALGMKALGIRNTPGQVYLAA